MTTPPGSPDVARTLVGFAHTLQAAGVAASSDRVHAMAHCLDVLDPTRRSDVYWAGRLTLCASPDDVAHYDRVFAAYFRCQRHVRPPLAVPRPVSLAHAEAAPEPAAGTLGEDRAERSSRFVASASDTEVLTHRDIALLTAAERAQLNRLLAALTLPSELRRTRRFEPAHGGVLDPRRTIRETLRRGGEIARLHRRTHRQRPRRVVLLVDVSGSMQPYADALLRFTHAAVRRRGASTDVFTIGTRLTRVTSELSAPDPDVAMARLSDAVPDWSGGTRLGEKLKAFLDEWGQRLARGAVVVVLSDGWERGDATLLGDQMGRLHRLAHRVVWCNPRKGQAGYAPLAAGIAAALPHVDDFVEGHTLAALERLAAVVSQRGWPGGRRA